MGLQGTAVFQKGIKSRFPDIENDKACLSQTYIEYINDRGIPHQCRGWFSEMSGHVKDQVNSPSTSPSGSSIVMEYRPDPLQRIFWILKCDICGSGYVFHRRSLLDGVPHSNEFWIKDPRREDTAYVVDIDMETMMPGRSRVRALMKNATTDTNVTLEWLTLPKIHTSSVYKTINSKGRNYVSFNGTSSRIFLNRGLHLECCTYPFFVCDSKDYFINSQPEK